MHIESKCPFLINDSKLLKKYNEIWKKVGNIIKKRILKLKKNITMGKSKQVFTIMKYQKKALNALIDQ